MIKISTIAFEARKSLSASGYDIPYNKSLELLAALWGYGTYAALKTSPSENVDALFPHAEHVVFQREKLQARLHELQLMVVPEAEVAQAVLSACRSKWEGDGTATRFHLSMDDFKDHIAEDVQDRAVSDDYVLSAYAGTNASADEFLVEDYEYESLVDAEGDWIFVGMGAHTGEIDPDRMYSGHAGNFTATYTFEKVGRVGLIEIEFDIGLDFDRDYS